MREYYRLPKFLIRSIIWAATCYVSAGIKTMSLSVAAVYFREDSNNALKGYKGKSKFNALRNK